jgi:hypothetical protein
VYKLAIDASTAAQWQLSEEPEAERARHMLHDYAAEKVAFVAPTIWHYTEQPQRGDRHSPPQSCRPCWISHPSVVPLPPGPLGDLKALCDPEEGVEGPGRRRGNRELNGPATTRAL